MSEDRNLPKSLLEAMAVELGTSPSAMNRQWVEFALAISCLVRAPKSLRAVGRLATAAMRLPEVACTSTG